jgi:hypothetical protein
VYTLEMRVPFPNKRSKPFRKERNSTFRFKRVTAASRKDSEAFSCGVEPKSSYRGSAKLDDKRQLSPI